MNAVTDSQRTLDRAIQAIQVGDRALGKRLVTNISAAIGAALAEAARTVGRPQIRAAGTGLTRSTVFRELLPDNGFTDCSALVYRNLAPIFGALPPGAMGTELGAYEGLLRESSAPGLFCVYGLDDRILVSGTGPSLVSLAPLMGLQSMLSLDEITAESAEDATDRLSSQS